MFMRMPAAGLSPCGPCSRTHDAGGLLRTPPQHARLGNAAHAEQEWVNSDAGLFLLWGSQPAHGRVGAAGES